MEQSVKEKLDDNVRKQLRQICERALQETLRNGAFSKEDYLIHLSKMAKVEIKYKESGLSHCTGSVLKEDIVGYKVYDSKNETGAFSSAFNVKGERSYSLGALEKELSNDLKKSLEEKAEKMKDRKPDYKPYTVDETGKVKYSEDPNKLYNKPKYVPNTVEGSEMRKTISILGSPENDNTDHGKMAKSLAEVVPDIAKLLAAAGYHIHKSVVSIRMRNNTKIVYQRGTIGDSKTGDILRLNEKNDPCLLVEYRKNPWEEATVKLLPIAFIANIEELQPGQRFTLNTLPVEKGKLYGLDVEKLNKDGLLPKLLCGHDVMLDGSYGAYQQISKSGEIYEWKRGKIRLLPDFTDGGIRLNFDSINKTAAIPEVYKGHAFTDEEKKILRGEKGKQKQREGILVDDLRYAENKKPVISCIYFDTDINKLKTETNSHVYQLFKNTHNMKEAVVISDEEFTQSQRKNKSIGIK